MFDIQEQTETVQMPPIKNLRTLLIMGAASTVFATGALISWLSATRSPEIVASPAIGCDSDWLIEPSPDLAYSSKQVKLYLDNQDPTACPSLGLRQSSVRRQALVYISEAVRQTSNPKHSCYRGTVPDCLESFGRNITAALQKSKSEEDILKQYGKLEALIMAADAYINGNVSDLKPSEYSPTLAASLVENYFRDYRQSVSLSNEGIVREMKERQEEERRAEQELKSGTVPLKRGK